MDVNNLRALAEALPRQLWHVEQPESAGGWHVVRKEDGACIDESQDGGFDAATAAFIAACNPVAILELLDRLAAAEASDQESIAMYRRARDARDALKAVVVGSAQPQVVIQNLRCTNCGHTYEVKGSQVGGHRYFGGGSWYCPMCEGIAEAIEG